MKNIEPGFYYHFKHDPQKSINNYAYEVIGIGRHTEMDNEYVVIYRPLYPNEHTSGNMFAVRPLAMFAEDVERNGIKYERFRRITDPGVITQLSAIRDAMF